MNGWWLRAAGAGGTVCARGAWWALLGNPSTSPLVVTVSGSCRIGFVGVLSVLLGSSTSSLEGMHATMSAIVPPTPKERQVMRRGKLYRCSKWCIAFCLFAVVAFIAGAQLVGFAAVGAAVIAAIGAVIYRFIEAPQRVTVRDHFHRSKEPPLIHFKGKD